MKQNYDVIIVGGGFAGVAAAIGAARHGAKTLLIEKYNCLGGAACFDLVYPFMRYWTKMPETGERKMLSRGIFEEIVDRMTELCGKGEYYLQNFNTEYLKVVLNRMTEENGVDVLYGTSVVKTDRTAGKLNEITIYNVGGLSTLTASVYVDATGDANIAAMSGFPYRLGRESDSLCQPMTLCFRMVNVDMDLFLAQRADISPLYKKYQAEGKIKNPREDVLTFIYTIPGVIHFNTTRVVKLNPTDAADVTKAEFIAREQIIELVDFLKANFSAFANAQLMSSGIQIGARESRMIDGLHILTKDEIVACTKFADGISACNYDIDIHSPDGSGTSHYYFPEGQYYTIPYGCLVPQGADNLLVTGRCISVDHDAQASVRIMPTCCTLGEAAGVAAAMAVQNGCSVARIDTDALRDLLRRDNVVVD